MDQAEDPCKYQNLAISYHAKKKCQTFTFSIDFTNKNRVRDDGKKNTPSEVRLNVGHKYNKSYLILIFDIRTGSIIKLRF